MEPTTPTDDGGRLVRLISKVPFVLVALVLAMVQAFIMNVGYAIGFFAWVMATYIGNRRRVYGRRTERFWILTTSAVYVAVVGLVKLAS